MKDFDLLYIHIYLLIISPFTSGCRELDIKTVPAANAALSQNYYQENVGWRRACTNRGFCQAGCSTGAKAILLNCPTKKTLAGCRNRAYIL